VADDGGHALCEHGVPGDAQHAGLAVAEDENGGSVLLLLLGLQVLKLHMSGRVKQNGGDNTYT
jgi:hypothetical protein